MRTRLVTVAAATASVFMAASGGAQTQPPAVQAAPADASRAEKPRTIVELLRQLRNQDDPPAAAPAMPQLPVAAPPPRQTAQAARRARPKRTVQSSKPRRSQTAANAAAADAPWPNPDAPLPAALAVADTLHVKPAAAGPQPDDPTTRRLDDAFAAIAGVGTPVAGAVPMAVGNVSPAPASVMHLLSYAASAPDERASARAENPAGPVRPPSSAIEAMIDSAAAENGVPADLARALVFVLSSYNPRATGQAGEIGLMQLIPETARAMGFTGSASELYDPAVNLKYGMRYLAKAQKLGGGGTCQTVHRYSAGHYAKAMTQASQRFCAKVQTAMRQQ